MDSSLGLYEGVFSGMLIGLSLGALYIEIILFFKSHYSLARLAMLQTFLFLWFNQKDPMSHKIFVRYLIYSTSCVFHPSDCSDTTVGQFALGDRHLPNNLPCSICLVLCYQTS